MISPPKRLSPRWLKDHVGALIKVIGFADERDSYCIFLSAKKSKSKAGGFNVELIVSNGQVHEFAFTDEDVLNSLEHGELT